MFLLLSLLVISSYICIWFSLLYLFHTISAYITALFLHSFPIKLLLYFSYLLQDSLTRICITLMFITSWYHYCCFFITSIFSTIATHYISSLHPLISFILLYFISQGLYYSPDFLSGLALSYLVLLPPSPSCI